MQFTSRYLVNNRINIIANVAGFVTEYRPVYQRQIQVYKGIDNVLQFKLLNAEQKPVTSIEEYTPKFVAFDENKNLIIERDCVILQETDSTIITNKGLFTVTITENDLLNVKDQFLHYNIYLVNSNGAKSITYADAHFSNSSVIKVSSDAFPAPRASKEILFLDSQENGSYWVTNAEYAQPGINGNEALHTVVVYSDGYVGTITVQATLDNQIEVGTDWADIATLTFDGTETEPVPINFNGVFNYLRFKASADPANKITKILIRN
jgi:hypothetical protein